MTKYYKQGAIVKVLAGREIGQIFIIKDVEKNFAYLVNGKSRPLDCPKKKNFKHLYLLDKFSNLDFSKCNDSDVIKYLKDYSKSKLDCK